MLDNRKKPNDYLLDCTDQPKNKSSLKLDVAEGMLDNRKKPAPLHEGRRHDSRAEGGRAGDG